MFYFTVKMKVKPVKPPKNKLPDIVSILSILGAVVLSCLVTSIVFCAIRRHRKGICDQLFNNNITSNAHIERPYE